MSKKSFVLGFLVFVIILISTPIIWVLSIDKVEGLRWTTKSSAEAKNKGVFERYMKPSAYRIEHKGLYTIIIKEVYVEKFWTCGPRCKTAENIGDADVATLVVTLQKGANAGKLQEAYFISVGKSDWLVGKKNDSLLTANIYPYPQYKNKPIKLYFYEGVFNNKTLIDSLLLN